MILAAAVLALLWSAVVLRVPTLWRDRRQRALWAAIFALALARTAAFGPVADAIGMPMLPHFLGVAVAFFLLRFIGLVTGRGGARWQVALVVVVLVTMVVLGAASGGIDTRADLLAADLDATGVAYWVVLEGYLGAVLVTGAVLFAGVARQAPAGLPRLGLWASTAGTGLVALYAALKTGLVVAHGVGVTVDFVRIEPTAYAVQTVGIFIGVAGLLVPATRRARSAVAAYRSLLALRPLWTAMRDAFPQVILFSPRRALIEMAGIDDVHLRLYRRVIEIRDGMLALRPFHPGTYPPAAEPAVAEAEAIALALRRRAAGAEPAEQPGSWAPVGPEMADEVAWLSQVSIAFRKVSPDAVPTPRPSGSAR